MWKTLILVSFILILLMAGCGPSGYAPPMTSDLLVSVDEDSSIDITLTAGILQPDSVTWAIVNSPTHGSLAGTLPDCTYTPDPDYNGSDSFTFKVDDWYHESNIASVYITVSPVNDIPVADSQSVPAEAGYSQQIVLTGSDIDGDALSYTIATEPSNGNLSGTPPNVTYLSEPDYIGPDSFSFRVNDGSVDSTAAVVTLTVTPRIGIWFVDIDATGTADGRSWANAFSHPQNGIDMAVAGEEVWVAGGTYASMDTVGSMPVLAMKAGVEIYGGFEGSEATLSERDLSSNATVLDGEYLVGNVVIGASNARLDGFVVTGGYTENERGAGMFNEDLSGLKVMNSVFTGNEAINDEGGGMYNREVELEIGNCVFTDNSAFRGGGIYVRNSTAHIVNTTILGNTATDQGGAIHNRDGSISLVNSIVYGNAPDQISNERKGETVVTNSDIQEDDYAGADGNINADPVCSDDDCRLGSASPCIDAGDNAAVMSTSYFYDLDSNDRILDGDGDGTATVDMGAYEFIP